MGDLLKMEEPRKSIAGMMSGLDIRYDLGQGHPLLGRRMPDFDILTASGPRRVFSFLHEARPLLINFGARAPSISRRGRTASSTSTRPMMASGNFRCSAKPLRRPRC